MMGIYTFVNPEKINRKKSFPLIKGQERSWSWNRKANEEDQIRCKFSSFNEKYFSCWVEDRLNYFIILAEHLVRWLVGWWRDHARLDKFILRLLNSSITKIFRKSLCRKLNELENLLWRRSQSETFIRLNNEKKFHLLELCRLLVHNFPINSIHLKSVSDEVDELFDGFLVCRCCVCSSNEVDDDDHDDSRKRIKFIQ